VPRSLLGRHKRRRRAIHQLGAVTLLLIFWAVFYRLMGIYSAVAHPWELDMGWLNSAGPGFPAIPVIAFVLVGAIAMTLVVFLERENRYPAAFALAAVNLGFVAMQLAILHVHASFARDLARFRLSGALSWSTLAEGIHGRWEVTAREAPAGSSEFPARALNFDRWGFIYAHPTRSSERVRASWQIEAEADATFVRDPSPLGRRASQRSSRAPAARIAHGSRCRKETVARVVGQGPEADRGLGSWRRAGRPALRDTALERSFPDSPRAWALHPLAQHG
jgi:hypothetical protein